MTAPWAFRAVGIELLNSGTQDFTDPQMRALRRLFERLTQRFGVARRHVLGHGEINHAARHLKLNKKNEVSGAELHPRDRLQAPNQATVKAVVAAIDAILNAPP